MDGLPIGFYTGLLGISIIVTLASGIYALLRSRNIARWADRRDNEVTPGPRERLGKRQNGGSRIAVVIFSVSTCVVLALIWLIATGTIGSGQTSHDPTVQRP